jgi:hypothetical protein
MTRSPDLAYEALAEATSTDWNEGRGELNAALRSIKSQWGDDALEYLPSEIHTRAKMYRRAMPDVVLTPTALAKHWLRVLEMAQASAPQATNQSASRHDCITCGGHGFVVYQTRPFPETDWMRRHGFKSQGSVDEMAPCPVCSTVDASFRRYDGSKSVPPDPEKVIEMMSR